MAISVLYSAVTKEGKLLLLVYRMKDQWLFFSNLQSIAEIEEKIISFMVTLVPVSEMHVCPWTVISFAAVYCNSWWVVTTEILEIYEFCGRIMPFFFLLDTLFLFPFSPYYFITYIAFFCKIFSLPHVLFHIDFWQLHNKTGSKSFHGGRRAESEQVKILKLN